MSGARKHMQRSHRSYQQSKAGIFNTFERNAYSVAFAKHSKLTLGQKINQNFKNIIQVSKSLVKRKEAC